MITNQFPDFKHTNFQISTPTPFEVYQGVTEVVSHDMLGKLKSPAMIVAFCVSICDIGLDEGHNFL